MALGANINAANLLIDQIKSAREDIKTKTGELFVLEQTLVQEVQDAYENGLGSLQAGFLPNDNGTYLIKRAGRAISIEWDYDNLKVMRVKVLRPGEFNEEVGSL